MYHFNYFRAAAVILIVLFGALFQKFLGLFSVKATNKFTDFLCLYLLEYAEKHRIDKK